MPILWILIYKIIPWLIKWHFSPANGVLFYMEGFYLLYIPKEAEGLPLFYRQTMFIIIIIIWGHISPTGSFRVCLLLPWLHRQFKFIIATRRDYLCILHFKTTQRTEFQLSLNLMSSREGDPQGEVQVIFVDSGRGRNGIILLRDRDRVWCTLACYLKSVLSTHRLYWSLITNVIYYYKNNTPPRKYFWLTCPVISC